MAPITKDNDVLTAIPSTSSAAPASTSFRPDETASRPQPVALELPVTVNGARTVDGSDKREPFSESTKTVLVFGTGAVLRLSSPVAPGQLLFLTNDKTKKEVVCQVVKSKNYRSTSGYVELEFTEPVVGFWGMRFPSDRVAAPVSSPPPTIPAAKVSPIPPAPINPAPANLPAASPVSGASIFAASKSDAPASFLEPPASQSKAQISLPGPSALIETQPALPAPQATQPPSNNAATSASPVANSNEKPLSSHAPNMSSLASSFLSLISSPEIPPAVPPQKSVLEPKSVSALPVSSDVQPGSSTAGLHEQTARLQEQLSALAFADAPGKLSVPAASDSKEDAPLASKIVELASHEAPTPASVLPAKVVPRPIKSALDAEELKIPSWLEPLARNAAAPASTQELIEREKAKHATEIASRAPAPPELSLVTAPEAAPEAVRAVELPGIGNLLPLDDEPMSLAQSSGGSKKGFWLAAAAVIVAAVSAGGWYYLQNSQTASGPVAPITRNVIPEKSTTTPATPPVQPATQPAPQIVPPVSLPLPKSSQPDVAPATPSVKPAESSRPVPAVRDNSTNGAKTIPAASTERIPKSVAAPDAVAAAPPQPEPKKPNIGEVHLASPMVNRPVKQADGIAAPTISEGDSAANLGAGLSEPSSGQPAAPEAPLPVGGDVRPAKLISSVSPAYPALAKTEHVVGDVRIDALIDATGKVTTMKVLSGPALLQRAAMDALRQWKYQPATLDGKPVPMHLTVTLQFRMP
jgi:protein TonB